MILSRLLYYTRKTLMQNTNLREKQRLNNPAEGANFGVHGRPLCEAPVLPRLQQVLSTVEVGKLKKDPGAL